MKGPWVSDRRLGELIKLTDTLEKPHIEELRSILLELRELRAYAGKLTPSHMRLMAALDRCRTIAADAITAAERE